MQRRTEYRRLLLMVTALSLLFSAVCLVAQSPPQLRYGSYFGGDRLDRGRGVTVDEAGNIYVVGVTTSRDVPVTFGAYDTVTGSRDIFVAKFDPTGRRLIWGRYVGGTGDDDPVGGVRIGPSGEVVVAGVTTSGNFPVRPGGLTTLPQGGTDGFLFALRPDGSDFLWSTYLGGSGEDTIVSFTFNVQNDLVVVGHSSSTNLPVPSGGTFSNPSGGLDIFALRLTTRANGVISGSYLGGGLDDFASDMTLEPGGATYITGWTSSNNFPTTTGAARQGGFDAFAVKFRFDLSVLDFGTLVGGSGNDFSRSVAVDAVGDIYITGETASSDFPDNVGLGSPGSWFASKIDLQSGGLDYSLFVSSDMASGGFGVEVDPAGRAVLVGRTSAPGFPVIGGGETPGRGKSDVAVVRLAADGLSIEQTGLIGGREDEEVAGHFFLTSFGDLYLTGLTRSDNFPMSRFSFDSMLNRTATPPVPDAFLLLWSLNNRPNLAAPVFRLLDTLECDTVVIDSFYVYNDGTAPLVIDQNFLRVTDGKFTLLEPDAITNITVSPGDSVLYVVRFSTAGIGFVDNDLLISSSDSLLGKRQISIGLRAGRLAPSLQPLPPVRFGNVLICNDSTIEVSLITNGDRQVTVLDPVFTSGGSVFSLDPSPTFPLNIPRNSAVPLRIRFAPDRSGLTYNDTLVLPVAECAASSLRIPLSGHGEEVRAEGIPDTIFFQPLSICEASHDTIITIRNAGTAGLTLDQGSMGGEGFILGEDFTFPQMLAPGDELAVPITFRPDRTGDFSGELLLGFVPCDTTFRVVLKGSQPGTPFPSVDRDTIDFGTLVSCRTSLLSLDSLVRITNPSDAEVLLGVPILSSPFRVIPCGLTVPDRIAPHETIRLCLRYEPFDTGTESRTLSIPFTVGGCADTLYVQLRGTHVIPEPEIDIDRIDLGLLEGCVSSFDTAFILRNPSAREITVDGRLVTSGLALLSPTLPRTIEPGDSLRIVVRFQPDRAGASTESIRLLVSPCSDTLEVEVAGTIEGVVVAADPDSLIFAPQLPCDPPVFRHDTLSLSWSGVSGVPVVIQSVRLVGSSGEFLLFDSTILVGAEIPAGGNLDVPLAFASSVVGEHRDTLEVVLAPCGDTLLIPVRGNVVVPDLIVGSGLFGNVNVGGAGSRLISITNNSPLPLELDTATLPGLPFEADLTGITLPLMLGPGDILTIPVTFKPQVEGGAVDSLTLRLSDGCDFFRKIYLSGTGVGNDRKIEFCIRGLYSEPGHNGDTAEIRIETEDLDLSGGPVDLDFYVRFDPLRFQYVGPVNGTTRDVDERAGTAVIRAPGVERLPDDLPTIRLRLLAGAAPFALAGLDSVALVGGDGVEPLRCDTVAVVTIIDRCFISGISLGRFPNGIDKIAPNPADETVEITFQQLEDAVTTITLWDASGREVGRPLESFMPGGRYSVSFAVADLPPGLYLFRIQAGTWSRTEPLLIRR